MSAPFDSSWKPDPQLLAAYFDGELEGRDDLADVRARIETWLETHPESADEWAQHRQLQKLWLDTTPAEPSAAAWDKTAKKIAVRRRQPIGSPQHPWLAVGVTAASIALIFGLLFGILRYLQPTDAQNEPVVLAPREKPKLPLAVEADVFPVATAAEVVVRRIEGADTSLLAVGRMPVEGMLELAAPGDVRVFMVRPAAQDRMMPNVRHDGPLRPMIWMPLETEE